VGAGVKGAIGICAVVPAAGRGSRLGIAVPKLLAPLGEGLTVWSILRDKLLSVAEHINVIVSPEGFEAIEQAAASDIKRGQVTLTIQVEPHGMGDAIFHGVDVWARAQTILIVWGDQVFVSEQTLRGACALHRGDQSTVVLPVTRLERPYVEYIFDERENLSAVRQSREGDRCAARGFGDLGTFVLSSAGLEAKWREYLQRANRGRATDEVNFLPFLPYLSHTGWAIKRLEVADQREARGINTPEDLAYFQSVLGKPAERRGAVNE
jgi:bifunctional UDP-N-acetylglucosamine pyrophosphorylase/glucosamine-1-phosphate N-acetyltransferase